MKTGGRRRQSVGGEGGTVSRQPAPRGGRLARDSLGGGSRRVGDEYWGCEGAAAGLQGRRVRGRAEGEGRRRLARPTWKARNQPGRSVTAEASRRRRRASMEVPGVGRGIGRLKVYTNRLRRARRESAGVSGEQRGVSAGAKGDEAGGPEGRSAGDVGVHGVARPPSTGSGQASAGSAQVLHERRDDEDTRARDGGWARIGMCSVDEGHVFSFEANVFSFCPDVFTFEGQVFSVRRNAALLTVPLRQAQGRFSVDAGMTGMCPLCRANVSSSGPDVSTIRPNVSTLAREVSVEEGGRRTEVRSRRLGAFGQAGFPEAAWVRQRELVAAGSRPRTTGRRPARGVGCRGGGSPVDG